MKKAVLILVGFLIFGVISAVEAREEIRIVGSSAVLPYVQTVAENFSLHFDHPSPSIEITGVGAGFRLFCAGVGYEHPDVIATARPVSDAELAFCRKNGAEAVVEIAVGLDAIALANATASEQTDFTAAQLFAALSAKVAQNGRIVENPYENWSHIAPTLPDLSIRVMGPAPNSPHYDAFTELVMRAGCAAFPGLMRLNREERMQLCYSPRQDGAFVPGLNNDLAVLRWLRNHPEAFAVVPLSLVDRYPDYIRANRIDGAEPEPGAVSSGRYPLARAVYLYVKERHVAAVQGLQQFLYEFTGERAIGPEGYLADNGFLYLDDRKRNAARDSALSLAPLQR